MTSETNTELLSNVVAGPNEMDILKATFFETKSSFLNFTLEDGMQICASLLGILPYGLVRQNVVLLLSYHPERGQTRRVVLAYSHHWRIGHFIDPKTVEELLDYK